MKIIAVLIIAVLGVAFAYPPPTPRSADMSAFYAGYSITQQTSDPNELGEASGAMLSSNALQHKRMDMAYRFKGVSYFASTYTNTTDSITVVREARNMQILSCNRGPDRFQPFEFDGFNWASPSPLSYRGKSAWQYAGNYGDFHMNIVRADDTGAYMALIYENFYMDLLSFAPAYDITFKDFAFHCPNFNGHESVEAIRQLF